MTGMKVTGEVWSKIFFENRLSEEVTFALRKGRIKKINYKSNQEELCKDLGAGVRVECLQNSLV